MPPVNSFFRKPAVELFFLSFISLFFELLIIRWMLCDFKSFLIFKSFPLVTCFVGLGVGLSLGCDKNFRNAPLAMLAGTACMALMVFVDLNTVIFPAVGTWQWFDFSVYSTWQSILITVVIALAVLVVLAGPFAFMLCLGSRIGVLFNQQKPLNAYCIDIGGAICGSIIFALSSFLCLPPSAQLIIPAIVLLYYLCPDPKELIKQGGVLAVAITLACITMGMHVDGELRWTPYYRLIVNEIKIPQNLIANDHPSKPQLFLFENHCYMQAVLDPDVVLTAEGEKNARFKQIVDFAHLRRSFYELPHRIKQNDDVLILGAGAGGDVRETLAQGAKYIDAVEIDPETVKLGKTFNEAYRSPKVHVYCDDARHFINKTKRKYDLVFIACLDTIGVVGPASIRCDSYIHTADSYRKCISLLKPGGIFVVSFGNGAGKEGNWMRDKIYGTVKAAAGYSPAVIEAPNAFVFVAGDKVRDGGITDIVEKAGLKLASMPSQVEQRITTDDWPYLYVRPVDVDVPYLCVLLGVIASTILAGRKLLFSKENRGSDWQLFFLGAAFILLELQSISRLALVYGNTWLTSSVVVNGVLIMILLANAVIIRFGTLKQGALYVGLFGSLLLSYFFPVQQVLGSDPANVAVSNGLITLITLLPMFMAGLIFATAYSKVKTPNRSFALNLMGSVAGGLLEYISINTGLNSLVLLALGLYLVSYVCYRSDVPQHTALAVES